MVSFTPVNNSVNDIFVKRAGLISMVSFTPSNNSVKITSMVGFEIRWTVEKKKL